MIGRNYLTQLLHNAVAHPILGLLGYPAPDWAIRFHDWTAELAWPGHLGRVEGNPERFDVPEEVVSSQKKGYLGPLTSDLEPEEEVRV